jgi:hypothetical protein
MLTLRATLEKSPIGGRDLVDSGSEIIDAASSSAGQAAHARPPKALAVATAAAVDIDMPVLRASQKMALGIWISG